MFVTARVTETHPDGCTCTERLGLPCGGGDIPYAHLLLICPLPGLPPDFPMRWVKRIPLALFDRYEKERGHYVRGGSEDPALWSYDQMASDAITRLASAAEMNLPEDDPNGP